MRSIILSGLALLLSGGATLLALLIVVPIYPLWTLSVGAGEWSLWLGLIGLLGALLGWLARGWTFPVALVLGLAAIGLALLPLAQSLPVARRHGVALSLGEYLWGWRDLPSGSPPTTVTFATVDGQALQLDIYGADQTAGAPRPAIVVVHGGSWSGGVRSDFPRWNRWLVAQGYTVFDIDYRLGPQPNWQTATADVKCAVGWVKQHAAEYNIDPQRMALLGRSAGGHLALLAAYTPRSSELPPSCAAPDTSVRAVVSFYGPADLVWGYNVTADANGENGSPALERFLGGSPRRVPERYRLAAPISQASPQAPPTLLLHGGRDQVVGVQHTVRLAAVLSAAGVAHETVYVPYAQHGFDYNYSGWGSQITRPVLREFLQRYVAQP